MIKHLEHLEKLNLSKESFVLTGSGSLALREICENADIDIAVLPETFKELAKRFGDPNHKGTLKPNDHVEIRTDFWDITAENLFKTAEVVKGFQCMPVREVLEAKRRRNLEKDPRHIAFIEDYLVSRETDGK